MHPARLILRLIHRVAVARQGASTLEFAFLMALFFLPLVLAVIDLGMGMWVRMEVGNSARAGAEFATYCKCADDQQILPVVQTTIRSAEQSATGLGASVTAHTAQYCGCTDSAGTVSISFGDGTSATVTGLSLPTGAQIYADPVLNQTNLPSCASTGISACGDGSIAGTYVTVTATTTYTPMLPYPGIVPASGSFTLTADATARIY